MGPRTLSRTLALSTAVFAAAGCDLSYLTSELTSGGAGALSSGSGASGAAGSGAVSSSGGSGGAAPTALQLSMAFGDPKVDDSVAELTSPGNIRVRGLSDGSVLVAFHAAGKQIMVAETGPFAANMDVNSADPDIFVVHVSAGGEILNSLQLPMPGAQIVNALAVAGDSGPYYVAGRAITADLSLPDIGTLDVNGNDGFVIALDSGLNVIGAALLGGDNLQLAQSLAIDPQGDVWVAGQLALALDITGPLGGLGCAVASYTPVNQERGGFLAHLSGDLSECKEVLTFGPSAQSSGSPVHTETLAIAVNAAGDRFLAGRFGGTMKVGSAPEMKADTGKNNAGFIVKLAANGQDFSGVLKASSNDNRVYTMEVRDSGILLGGTIGTGADYSVTQNNVTQMGQPCVPSNNQVYVDGMLVTLDPATGNCKWGARLSGQGTDVVMTRAVGVDLKGSAWAIGAFSRLLTITSSAPGVAQPGSLDSESPAESFALRFDATGSANQPFAQAWAGAGDQVACDMAALPEGRIAVVGSYVGTIPGGTKPLSSGATDPHDYFLLFIDPKYPAAHF